jgi:hypothetical protein
VTSILSFDPAGKGGDTGIVLLDYLSTMPPRVRESWAVSGGYNAFCDWLRTQGGYDEINPDVVIVETFIHFKNIKIETTPILIEGAIRYVWPNVVLSPASGKNTAVPDDVLKRLGLYFPGDHHRDRTEAARHAVRWLKNQRHVPTLRAGWTA